MRYAALTSLLALLASLCAPALRAEEERSWWLNLTPYYWMFNADARLTLDGQEFSFSRDFLEESGEFKPNAFGMYFSAVRDPWILSVIPQYTTIDVDVSDPAVKELFVKQTRIDFLFGRRWRWDLPRGQWFDLSTLGGARYRNFQAGVEYNDPEDLPLGDTETWFEPIVFANAEWWFSEKISAVAVGDASGFGAGSAPELDWAATVAGRWHWAQEFSLWLGYRWQSIDGYERDRATLDADHDGVILAIGMDWWAEAAPQPVPASRAHGLLDDPIRYATGGLLDEIPPDADPDDYKTQRWLDRAHDSLNRHVDKWVGEADAYLTPADRALLARDKSRIFIGLDTELAEEDGIEFSFKPRIRAKLDIPNLERDIKLVVSDRGVSETPGTDRFDEEDGLSLGLEKEHFLNLKKTRVRVGIRSTSKSLVDLEASIGWLPRYEHRQWRFHPGLEGYYRGDKGYGAKAAVTFGCEMQDRLLGYYVPAANWNEQLEDRLGTPEWSHDLYIIYLFEGTQEDYHRAFATRATVLGNFEDDATEYRWQPLAYRAPLYGKWLYYTITPQVTWKAQQDWEANPAIQLYIEALFWGTEKR